MSVFILSDAVVGTKHVKMVKLGTICNHFQNPHFAAVFYLKLYH